MVAVDYLDNMEQIQLIVFKRWVMITMMAGDHLDCYLLGTKKQSVPHLFVHFMANAKYK